VWVLEVGREEEGGNAIKMIHSLNVWGCGVLCMCGGGGRVLQSGGEATYLFKTRKANWGSNEMGGKSV
jgi:hypothetical protein